MDKRLRLRLRKPDDAITRAAQRRIKAEDDFVGGAFRRGRRLQNRCCRAVSPGDTLLHPLELLKADTHMRILPRARKLQRTNGAAWHSQKKTARDCRAVSEPFSWTISPC